MENMKRGWKLIIIIVCIFSILLIGFVSAACPGGDDDKIMKLFYPTNSHGALWSDTIYPIDICYSSIFGSVYTGENPHACTGSNKVLGLSFTTNAHVEIPSLNNYLTPVCYGDLICRNVTTACAIDERIVVRLYQSSNSHISNASTSTYPISICCKAGGVVIPPANAYWANKIGNPITEAQKGDTVLMIFENTGFPTGTELIFEIYEDDILFNDPIRVGGNAITGIVDSSGKATGEWTITQSDLDKTSDLNNFIFIANGNQSNELKINQTEDNEPPVAGIIGIKDRQIYFKDELLKFSQNSYDIDDDFTYVWNLGNGETRTGDSNNWNNYNFTYRYNTPGQKDIILTVTDSRGLVVRNKIAILVLDNTSEQVLAYISQPVWGEFILKRSVDFNATLSYAANWTGSAVYCLAGPCPLKTEGCPGTNPVYPGCQLNVNNAPQPLDPLFFNWTFINGLHPEIIKYHSGTGIIGAITTANYDNPTVPSYPHKAILEVTY